MKLKNVSRFFDTCPVYDGYTGTLLFKVQASTFLENSAEGTAAARRIISTAPEIVMPSHSVILLLDDLILIGASNDDEWKGGAIRTAYWTKKVTDAFRYKTPAQAALAQTGTLAHGQKKFLRETVNTQTDSELDPMWELYLSRSLSMPKGMFLVSGTTLYRVRMSYTNIDGFLTCQCDELDSGVVSVSFTTNSTYDPVTDTYGPGAVTTTGIPIDYSKAFALSSMADFKPEQGDAALVVAKSAVTPISNQQLSITTAGKFYGKWRILNMVDELDGWNLHIRR